MPAFERVLQAASDREVPIKDVVIAGSGGSFVVPLLNVPDWARGKEAIRAAAGDALSLREGLAAVSVVGDGLSTTGRPMLAFLAALRRANATPIALSGTALRLTAAIDPEALAAAQRALHEAFVLGD